MKIKIHGTDTSKLLWRDSPCTLRNVLQNPSVDTSERFDYGSIYFRDEVNKPKKVFTQFEKPELLLMNFRRQVVQATLRAKKAASKTSDSHGPIHDKKIRKKHTVAQQSNLYQIPKKLELRHDRHGNRSSYLGQYDIRDVTERLSSTRRNFYSSQRIDLSKPINFYPGPGSYFPQKKQKAFRNTYSQRIRSKSHKKSEE